MKEYATLEHGNIFKYSESSRIFSIRYMSAGISGPTNTRYFGYKDQYHSDNEIESTSKYFLGMNKEFPIEFENISLILLIFVCGILIASMILICECLFYRKFKKSKPRKFNNKVAFEFLN